MKRVTREFDEEIVFLEVQDCITDHLEVQDCITDHLEVQDCITDHPYPLLSVNVDRKPLNILQEALTDKEAWINNSKKTDTPPDFYSDKYNLMVEVMSVSDNECLNDKGQIVNPVRKRSAEMVKEVESSGILNNLNDNVVILTNPTLPELSKDEFHIYDYYVSSFERVVGNHIKKIPIYRKNHPGMKLIFIIMDESAAYHEVPVDRHLISHRVGDYTPIFAFHSWWLDKNLLKVFKNADLDYVLWYAPYKYSEIFDRNKKREFLYPYPRLCVIDPRKDVRNTVRHDPKKMFCSES